MTQLKHRKAEAKLQILNPDLSVIAEGDLRSDGSGDAVTVEGSSPCYVAVILNAGEKITLEELHFEMLP